MSKISKTLFGLVLAAWLTSLIHAQEATTKAPLEAQAGEVSVAIGNNQIRFSCHRAIEYQRLQIHDRNGEIVYDSGAVVEADLVWSLRDGNGDPLKGGLYAWSIILKDPGDESLRTKRGHLIFDRASLADKLWITTSGDAGADVGGAEVILNRSGGGAIAGTSVERNLRDEAGQQAEEQKLKSSSLAAGGAGTPNKIAKWISTIDLGDSVMTESGGKIGIGTSTPSLGLLDVQTAVSSAVWGTSSRNIGAAVHGYASSPTGFTFGVSGQSASSTGKGVFGYNYSSTGGTTGVYGLVSSDSGVGVEGVASNGSGATYGVKGQSSSVSGTGVNGTATANSGTTYGIKGESSSTSGRGVYGHATAGSGSTKGVYGQVSSTSGIGVQGSATSLSGSNIGVYGSTVSSDGIGVKGSAFNGEGGTGVYGEVFNSGGAGVKGVNHVTDGLGYGVAGEAYAPGAIGVYGYNPTGGSGYSAGYGGFITGRLYVNGYIQKLGGSFKIDHPLDPENKYLSHSFVESPDMKNIYDGVVSLDRDGAAVITLPDWFEALNKEFRYQLTCIGGFAAVYVAEELKGNRFKIAGGHPGLKVSWQLTGIRKDVFAEKYRIPIEEVKPDGERGFYLTPELFDKPAEKGIEWALDPEGMKQRKQTRERWRKTDN